MKITNLDALPAESVSHNPEINKRVMLHQGDMPPLTNFAQARFAPGQKATSHAHADMAEVFFVESGQGTITVDDRPHPLKAGVCVLMEGLLHCPSGAVTSSPRVGSSRDNTLGAVHQHFVFHPLSQGKLAHGLLTHQASTRLKKCKRSFSPIVSR